MIAGLPANAPDKRCSSIGRVRLGCLEYSLHPANITFSFPVSVLPANPQILFLLSFLPIHTKTVPGDPLQLFTAPYHNFVCSHNDASRSPA